MKAEGKNYWKFHCEEARHPGMWQRWLKHQCVAVLNFFELNQLEHPADLDY